MSAAISTSITAERALPGLRAPGPLASARAYLASENPIIDRVRRAQAGDVAAFEELFEQFQRGIFNAIYQMVRNEADAADLTQKVFIRAYKALPRLKAPAAFGAWLHRIALNMTRNHIRDTTRVRVESLDRPWGDDETSNPRDVADDAAGPAEALESAEVRAQVQDALGTLSDVHRMVVTLHHLEGHSVEEIAQMMDCSVGTVKSRLSRARAHLHRRLTPFVEAQAD